MTNTGSRNVATRIVNAEEGLIETLSAIGGLLFLHLPILLIFLYAFTTEEKSYQFPPPGLTTEWFAVAWNRSDIWPPLWLSLKVALISSLMALVLGTLCAAAMSRAPMRCATSVLVALPTDMGSMNISEIRFIAICAAS